MKKLFTIVSVLSLVLWGLGTAYAIPFSQTIDFDPNIYLQEQSNGDASIPYNYTHDLTSILTSTDQITDATLTIRVVDSDSDGYWSWGRWVADDEEYLTLRFDNGSWTSFFEVDTGLYTYNVLSYLTDRILNVSVSLDNFDYSRGDVNLDYSTLSGNYNSVPEPATMLLLGMGLLGMGFVGRRRFKK